MYNVSAGSTWGSDAIGGIMYKILTDLYSKNYQPQSQVTKQRFPLTDNTHVFQTLFLNVSHT